MNGDHAQYASDYLLGARAVLAAGKYLQEVVDEGEADDVGFATTMLLQAYDSYDSKAESYSRFMFDELESIPPTEKASRERIEGDTLAGALTDLQVANVFLAAGAVTSETGAKADPGVLDGALAGLELTTKTLERPLARPLSTPVAAQRFMFDDLTPTAPLEIASANVEVARVAFREASDKAFGSLVSDAKGALMPAIDALSKLNSEALFDALSRLGKGLYELPSVRRFVRRAIDLLAMAISKITSLLGDRLEGVRELVEKFIDRVKEGSLVEGILEWAFGVEESRASIKQLLQETRAAQDVIDAGTREVGDVAARFGEKAALVKRMVGIVTGLGGLLVVAVPQASLYVAVAYAAFVGYVVLTGLDHADSGKIINRVSGIGEVAQRVLA